jgi:hypothetical protein
MKAMLVIPDRGRRKTKTYEFEVVPAVGNQVMVKHGEEEIEYTVSDAWHHLDAEAGLHRYFAVLSRSELPGKWEQIESYIE